MKASLRIAMLAMLLFLPLSVVTSFDADAKQSQAKPKVTYTVKSLKAKKIEALRKQYRKAPVAANSPRFAALVVNAKTGQILYEKNAGEIRYPASLTKMMTLYLTFDALKKGKLSMDGTLPVSEKAASQPQTNIALEEGDRLPVRTAIESVIVRSANDSAMVLSEALGETSWNFALMMTKKARALGMKNTVFRNPNGLPDNGQYTTAYDMAKLGIALRRDFPEYYPMFKLQSFSYNGITYPGHNRVMEKYEGADGIKTGYIRASGFNLVTSVKKNGYNLVAVIMGGRTASDRDTAMINLLDRTFAQLESKQKTLSKSEFLPLTPELTASKTLNLARK